MRLFAPLLALFLLLLNVVVLEGVPSRRRLKVLVYSPLNAWSHMQFMGRIADTLVEEGHEVHLLKLIYDPVMGAKNESKLAQKVIAEKPRFTDFKTLDFNNVKPIQSPFDGNGFPRLTIFENTIKAASQIFLGICKEMVKNSELMEQLSAEKYDVGIAESYDNCAFAIFHRIGVGTQLSALAVPLFQMIAARFGIPTIPSYVPIMAAPPLSGPPMPFFERYLNVFNTFYDWARGHMIIPNEVEEQLFREAFGPKFPPIGKIVKNTSLVFVNSNPFLEFPRPISNKIVYIGGLVDSKVGELDKRSATILDQSSRGAVLVSFGSITDTTKMSLPMRRAFLGAFLRFPQYEFIWKLDKMSAGNDSALFANAKNVHTFEWVQQTAILRHPKVRAFISHCGQNSLSEAARSGVPIVAIPLFGDQLFNAIMAKYKGIAVHLDVRDLHEEEKAVEVLVDALEKILNSDSYRKNAQTIRKKMALTPFLAKEKLVRWVEFAAEFENLDELNLPTDDELHWIVYWSIDVLIFTVILCALSIFVAFSFFKFALKMIAQIFLFLDNGIKIKTH